MKRSPATPRLAKILDALQRLYAVKDAAEFPHHLMAVTSELLSAKYISFDQIDLATGQVVNVFDRPIPLSREEFMARWQALHHQHPGIAYLERGGTATVFKISDFLTQRQFRQTGLYQELVHPFGVTDQLGIIVPVPGHVIGVAVNRDTAFTTEECAMMEMLHPHFVQAFTNAQLFTSLRGQDALPDFTAWRRHGFTRRECEVLHWIVAGKRNGEIAIILGISPLTVKTHVERILARLGAETRTEAAASARRILGGG